MSRPKARMRKIGLIVIMGTIALINVGGEASTELKKEALVEDKEQQEAKEEVEIPVEPEIIIPEEVLASQDPVIQILLQQAESIKEVKEILADIESYPYRLLELASKKPETIPFVHSYTNYLDGKIEWSDAVAHTESMLPLFIQWDQRWGYEQYGDNYMAINGCGPTSLAMVVAGLTEYKDITPKDMRVFSEENQHYVDNIGTSWSLMTEGARAFGVKGEAIGLDKNSIEKALKAGQPIIASMKPGDFTEGGHFIVLAGITEDGKIIVNDSDSKIRSQMLWDIERIIEQSKAMWKFSIS